MSALLAEPTEIELDADIVWDDAIEVDDYAPAGVAGEGMR